MSQATVRGKVHMIEETKTFGQKGFRKRVLVLEQDNGRFTQYIPLEFIQDSCDSLDSLRVGQEIEVTYTLGGRKWQRDPSSEVKYFLSAEASSYRVMGGGKGGSDDDFTDAANDAFAQAAGDEEDLPF